LFQLTDSIKLSTLTHSGFDLVFHERTLTHHVIHRVSAGHVSGPINALFSRLVRQPTD